MSNKATLRTPSGLGKDVTPQNDFTPTKPLGVNGKNPGFSIQDRNTWWDVLFNPWSKWRREGVTDMSSALTTVHVMLMVFIANLFFCTLVVYSLGTAIVSGTNVFIIGFVSALVQAGLFYAISHIWTHEADMPLYLFPGLAWTDFFTLSGNVGAIACVGYSAMALAGAAAAGYICIALNNGVNNLGVGPLFTTNITFTNSGYAMYAFGTLMISFVYVYCKYFSSNEREEKHLHRKSAKATAITLFVFVLAFQELGIRFYNPATYLAGQIYNGGNWNNAGQVPAPPVTPWAWFIFFPLLMWFCSGFVLYGLMHLLSGMSHTSHKGYQQVPEQELGSSKIPYSSTGLKNRIHVEY